MTASALQKTEDFILKTREAYSAETLLATFGRYISQKGFSASAFVLLTDHYSDVRTLEEGMLHSNFQQDWLLHYSENSFFEYDPMIAFARRSNRPFKWFLDANEKQFAKDQVKVLASLRDAGYKDGMIVPIYLPGGRVIFCALGAKDGKLPMSPGEMVEMGYICHQVYDRFSQLADVKSKASEPPVLSPREKDVLYWSAQGKNNADIAEIMGVSIHTVDTMLRRSYKKLNVSNRISAVLKSITLGLISP